MVNSGRTLAELFNNPELSLDSQLKTAIDFDWVFIPDISYAAFGGWEFGGEIKWPEREFDQAPAITRYPANSVEEVMGLKIPDISNAGIIPLQKQFFLLGRKNLRHCIFKTEIFFCRKKII